jgi:hypothetical protein
MVAEDGHGIMHGTLIGHVHWSAVHRLTYRSFSCILKVEVLQWVSLQIMASPLQPLIFSD